MPGSLRAVSAALAAVACLAAAPGCGEASQARDGTVTLGFVNGASTEFHQCLQQAVEREATTRGARVVSVNSRQRPEQELANIESLIAQRVDALIVQTVDVEQLRTDIARARAAGIPIFLTSVMPDDLGGILGAVTVDQYQIGALDAGWVSNDAVGRPRTLGVIAGAPGAASDQVVSGLKSALPANVKVVATQPGMYNRGRAKAVAAAMIAQHPTLDYAFVANEDMAFGAAEAFRGSGKKVKIVTVNGTDEGLAAVKDGRFAATVANSASALGEKAVENVLDMLDGGRPNKITRAPMQLITRDNLTDAPRYCGA
ncbi:D-ribose ABC transporter substrate-binding protein [Paractinoplanes deccanensis]|uniref:D-ribose ABC transporter substrate-binding protein n=1 Tax=Paractinoplanes deccanensis TaxID=113561 RepID=A0ABQ3YHM2_9ACTN|nr:sugar ABC transporter substrate-binding protein [Actinoplanes deccanensis]GID79496.1 D-ribose ABC transporter substrate-binding protein [Actinoplanes deccanensis]